MEEVLRELTETELACVAGGLGNISNADSNQGIQVGVGAALFTNADSNQGVQGVNIGAFNFGGGRPD